MMFPFLFMVQVGKKILIHRHALCLNLKGSFDLVYVWVENWNSVFNVVFVKCRYLNWIAQINVVKFFILINSDSDIIFSPFVLYCRSGRSHNRLS